MCNSEDVQEKPSMASRLGLTRAREFSGDQNGATAIEFTILALPFMLLIFAILETCISFAGQQLLSNAADKVARELRTGQIKAATMTKTDLHDKICDELELIVAKDCPELEVDLREYATFAAAAAETVRYTGTGENRDIDTSRFAVTPGGSASRNMLRVFYRWPILTDIMRKRLSTIKGGKTLHFSSVVWQNEPY